MLSPLIVYKRRDNDSNLGSLSGEEDKDDDSDEDEEPASDEEGPLSGARTT